MEVEKGLVELILQTVFCKLRTNNTLRTTKLLWIEGQYQVTLSSRSLRTGEYPLEKLLHQSKVVLRHRIKSVIGY